MRFPCPRSASWLCGLALAAIPLVCAAQALPGPAQVRADWRSSEARLLDRHGRLLQEMRVDSGARRTDWTPLDEVSPAFLAALLRAEDKRFFAHAGVDWLAAGKAALSNWLADKPRGASTLSMQLAALLEPGLRGRAGRRDLGEKWDQMRAARQLEATWKKTEILEAYLNLAGFRGELTGIDAAARGLFDKRPAGLSEAESLILAALIRAPNAKADTVARRVCALAQGSHLEPACPHLRRLTLQALGGRVPVLPAADQAPHLAQRLLRETASVTALPPFAKGGAGGMPQPAGATHGRLSTTLDADLQRFVVATLREQLAYLAARNVEDAAALVVDNASGEVLAYASVSAASSPSPHSDGVIAKRQAGSTLKPFLYGLVLEQGLLTAASAIEDAPLAIATASGGYAPRNYDHTHRGLVSLRAALAGSLNIPAVRTLRLVGLEPFAASLAGFGFDVPEAADFYGYALALGSLDVSLEELVNAYRALANGGVFGPLRLTADAPRGKSTRASSRESAFLVADILSDRQARALTFGLENPLATRFWSAVKTGTSKDMRDNWCVGFSSRYTVGVWVGNFSGAPMRDVSGISGAAPAWAAILGHLHAGIPSSAPRAPAGLVRARVAPPGETPRREWFLRGSEPAGAGWNAATPPAEIVQPGDGDILALDPDIPADRQRLIPRARHAPAGAWWKIDQERLAEADWPLARGRHALILLDGEGRELDRVRFEVR
ncbi:MAG: penicillin-binding protein 1C [bacterium]|nr:MAG: penicillin-binding protein 1C [bacterium]KAF0148464.1 MAG: penicillin-binding protein 1C [bacterium]KAF0168008.1 MAG: penicillin-binding protein 1C [bacterium]TXT21247.1 MAG: penicillin-binding protein 1C [bacterium]